MRKIFIFALLFTLFTAANAQNDSIKESPITFGASYTGDNVAVISGGIKRGFNYLGLAHLEISLDTEKARLWKGGAFFLKASNTHGATPSATLIGDYQIASNIEAGEHSYLQELWYKQKIGNIEITAGLQDLNVEIAAVDYGSMFLNSSFGVIPIISTNLHAPIFPLTSVGITTKWNINDKTSWLNAIYDGSPTDFEQNPYNINWRLNEGDGLLFVTELQHQVNINGLPGIYKFGLFAHDHRIEKQFNKNLPDSLITNTAGAYLIHEQNLYSNNDKAINAFLQTGYSPSEISMNRFYIGAGLNLNGFLSKNNNDILGLAVAHAQLKKELGHETLIELSWKKQLSPCFYIQPDFQYIFHPSGKKSDISNALVGILRFGFEM